MTNLDQRSTNGKSSAATNSIRGMIFTYTNEGRYISCRSKAAREYDDELRAHANSL